MNRTLTFVLVFLRIIVGCTFIISAALKLMPIAPFENLILKLDIIPWQYIAVASRFLIGFEFFIGIALVANVFAACVLRIGFGTLIVFSLYVAYLYFFVSKYGNCGCFGELIALNPLESLIKNALLIAAIVFMIMQKHHIPPNQFAAYQKYIIVAVIVFSFALPYAAGIPHIMRKDAYTPSDTIPNFPIDLLQHTAFSSKPINYTKGKHVVCLASPSCAGCKYVSAALSKIYSMHQHYSISVILPHTPTIDEEVPNFLQETGILSLPYGTLAPEYFLTLVRGSVPYIVFIQDGKVYDVRRFNDFHIGLIFSFFTED